MSPESEMTVERWLRLMNAWGFTRNQNTFDALLAAYSEKGWHYHTAEHVSACLRHLDRHVAELEVWREVELALWFHDAIYKPLSAGNELASADWAVAFLTECGAASAESARVHRLIMVTQHHAPVTKDDAALVDIDLSILGAAPAVYAIFEQGVRKEYRFVPWFIYRKKRAAVLRGFLERQQIYTSGLFAEAVERQAKTNLLTALNRLEGRV